MPKPAVALTSACLALASGAAPYAQFGGDGMRSKLLQYPVPANLTIVANASLSPCGGGGGGGLGGGAERGQSQSSCTFVTQMLMGADERAFFVWDSASGVTAYDAATLAKLFSVPETTSHSCFSLDAGEGVLWAQRAGARGAHEMIVTNYSVGRAGAVKLADATVPVDTWETGGGQQRWAATCFVQAPPSQWPQAASPLYVTQFQGALRIRAGAPSARWPSSHILAARPPAGCALNTSLSTPLLLNGATAGAQQQQGSTAIAVYMSCEEAVPTKLVYYTWPWQQDNQTNNPNPNPHRTAEPPLLDALWSADVGSIDPVFSDYRFVGAAGGSIALYQDADAKAIGAISAAGDAAHRPGATLWTKSTGGPADGVLAAGETTALLWTELNATVTAVDVHTGSPQWSADIRAACGEDPTTAVQQAAAMLGPAGDSALLLAWFRTGANCLVEVRGPGTVVQALHLGFTILPPNAANVLLARNGSMLVYLADRVLHIEGM